MAYRKYMGLAAGVITVLGVFAMLLGMSTAWANNPNPKLAAPVVLGPGGTQYAMPTTATWSHIPAAEKYHVSVLDVAANTSMVFNNLELWGEGTEISVCDDVVSYPLPYTLNLQDGKEYRIKVQAESAALGLSDWSPEMTFMIDIWYLCQVTVKKDGQPVSGAVVETATGTEALQGITGENGVADFRFKSQTPVNFKTVYNGLEYFSGEASVPGSALIDLSDVVVHVRLMQTYPTWTKLPVAGITVTPVDAEGQAVGAAGIADQNGDVIFILPNAPDIAFAVSYRDHVYTTKKRINAACVKSVDLLVPDDTRVQVVLDGIVNLPDMPVEAFLSPDTPTGQSTTTDTDGVGGFFFPTGQYAFSTVYNGVTYKSGSINAGEHGYIFIMIDTDSDGLPNTWETMNGLDPNVSNEGQDTDGDGLSDFDEYLYNANPQNGDTDGDGVSDSTEKNQGSDPSDPADGGKPWPSDMISLLEFYIVLGEAWGSDYSWNCSVQNMQGHIYKISERRDIHKALYLSVKAQVGTIFRASFSAFCTEARVPLLWRVIALCFGFWDNQLTLDVLWSAQSDRFFEEGQPDGNFVFYVTKPNITADLNCDDIIDSKDDAIEDLKQIGINGIYVWKYIPINDDNDDEEESKGNGAHIDSQNDYIDGDKDIKDLIPIRLQLPLLTTMIADGCDLSSMGLALRTINSDTPAVRVFSDNKIGARVLYGPEKSVSDNLLPLFLEKNSNEIIVYAEGVQQNSTQINFCVTRNSDPFYFADELDVNVYKAEYVVPSSAYYEDEPDYDAEPVKTEYIGVSNPCPTISAQVSAPTVSGTTASVTISNIEIKDGIADNIPRNAGADIESVKCFVNGEERQTYTVSSSESGTKGFWKQHPYKGTVSDITLDNLPLDQGAISIRLETSPNKAGNKGYASFSVNPTQKKQPDSGDTYWEATSSEMTFSGAGFIQPYMIRIGSKAFNVLYGSFTNFRLKFKETEFELIPQGGFCYMKDSPLGVSILATNSTEGGSLKAIYHDPIAGTTEAKAHHLGEKLDAILVDKKTQLDCFKLSAEINPWVMVTVDANNSGSIDDEDQGIGTIDPGMIISVNDDNDDEEEEQEDASHIDCMNDRIDGEKDKDDLKAIRLKLPMYEKLVDDGITDDQVNVTLTCTDGKERIRIFKNKDSNEIILGPEKNKNDSMWSQFKEAGSGELTFWAEGIEPGGVTLKTVMTLKGAVVGVDEAKITVIKMEFVVPGESYNNGEDPDAEPVATEFIGVSDPRPTVIIESQSATIGGSSVTVNFSGYLRDPIADNVPRGGGADIEELKISVNDEEVGTATLEDATDEKKGFWQQHYYKHPFSGTATVPLEEGTHTVTLTTSENAAGNTGNASIAVTLTKRAIPGSFEESDSGTSSMNLNIYFSSDITATSADQCIYYTGDRTPDLDDPNDPEDTFDPILTEEDSEDGRKSLLFQGKVGDSQTIAKARVLKVNGSAVPADGTVSLSPDQVDTLLVDVSYTMGDGSIMNLGQFSFTETANETRIFRFVMEDKNFTGEGISRKTAKGNWRVLVKVNHYTLSGSYVPSTICIKGLTGDSSGNYKIDIAGVPFTLDSSSADDGCIYLKGGSRFYFCVNKQREIYLWDTGKLTGDDNPKWIELDNDSCVSAKLMGKSFDNIIAINANLLRVDLIAHKMGTKDSPGAELTEGQEDDPLNLVIYDNDDNDNNQAGYKDKYSNQIGANDDDVALLTICQPKQNIKTGSMEITLSNPSCVRVFDETGRREISEFPITVNFDNPQGELSSLLTKDVSFLVECIKPNLDVIFCLRYKDSTGRTLYSDEVHMLLSFELILRRHIVESVRQQDSINLQFTPSSKLATCGSSSSYWDQVGRGIRIKSGVRPADAIEDLFVAQPDGMEYSAECFGALQMVFYRAILKTFEECSPLSGSLVFDRNFSGIDFYGADGTYPPDIEYRNYSKYIFGDWRYVSNPDVDPNEIAWQGENVIQMTNADDPSALFYGHPLSVTTLTKIQGVLDGYRKENAVQHARIDDDAKRLDTVTLMEMLYK